MSDFITPDLICGLLNAAVVVGAGINAQTCDGRRGKGSFFKNEMKITLILSVTPNCGESASPLIPAALITVQGGCEMEATVW